jgi:osmotically-inducible protein OsmY
LQIISGEIYMTSKDDHINRYGEAHARPARGKVSLRTAYEDELGMTRDEAYEEEVDWSHDPRSESAREKHYGKGPKGWLPDASIKQKVSVALYLSPDVDASEIEVKVEQGCVILDGSVKNRRQKRSAEECIENLPDVADVLNRLVIK